MILRFVRLKWDANKPLQHHGFAWICVLDQVVRKRCLLASYTKTIVVFKGGTPLLVDSNMKTICSSKNEGNHAVILGSSFEKLNRCIDSFRRNAWRGPDRALFSKKEKICRGHRDFEEGASKHRLDNARYTRRG